MKLTNEEFLTTLAKVVNAKPAGYRYADSPISPHQRMTSCRYSYDSCIVGEVFGEVAPDIRTLLLVQEVTHHVSLGMAWIRSKNIESGNAWRITKSIEKRFTPAQIAVLEWAQMMQDAGTPWSGILNLALGKLADAERGENITPTIGEITISTPSIEWTPKVVQAPSLEDVVHHEGEINIPMLNDISFMSKVLSPEPIFAPVKIKEIVEA